MAVIMTALPGRAVSWIGDILLLLVIGGNIATTDIFPLLALVQAIEDFVNGVVESNVVDKGSSEDGSNENRVAAENDVVKARSERLG